MCRTHFPGVVNRMNMFIERNRIDTQSIWMNTPEPAACAKHRIIFNKFLANTDLSFLVSHSHYTHLGVHLGYYPLEIQTNFLHILPLIPPSSRFEQEA